MQHVTFTQAKAAARDAYCRRKLTAQHPNQELRIIAMALGEYRCGIGASLTRKSLRAIGVPLGAESILAIEDFLNRPNILDPGPPRPVSVAAMVAAGIVDSERVEELAELQAAYSRWALCSSIFGSESCEPAEAEFLRVIYS